MTNSKAWRSRASITPMVCLTLSLAAAHVQASAVTLKFAPGDQLNLAISNTNPNMIIVPGDRVVNISSAAGMLTDKKNTKAGAVFFSSPSDNSKPFTFFVETELGQVFSVNAAPRNGEGRSYRLLPETQTARPLAKAWESAQPYESMLINLNRSLMQGVMPDGYGPATIDKELPLSASGLYATPDAAWVGNSLRVVRYKLTNPLSIPVALREQDFWQPGTRAVMVNPRYNRLIGGASTYLFVTRTQEHADGQR